MVETELFLHNIMKHIFLSESWLVSWYYLIQIPRLKEFWAQEISQTIFISAVAIKVEREFHFCKQLGLTTLNPLQIKQRYTIRTSSGLGGEKYKGSS